MPVIPDSVIQNWREQYKPSSPLWAQYPELPDAKDVIPDLVERDREIVRGMCIPKTFVPSVTPQYTATAGPPLSGKSTILDQEIAADKPKFAGAVRVDPDRWGLRFMTHSYVDYLMSGDKTAQCASYEDAQKRAYDLARPGSNDIALSILNDAVRDRRDIVHGTTMTGNVLPLAALKREGYAVNLLLCNAPDDVRADAQIYRANVQGFYQSTPEDVREKGIAFPQKMNDYFKYGDNLTMFWRNGVTENAVRCAAYSNGQKTVLDQDGYDAFVAKYEGDRRVLAAKASPVILPSFKEIEDAYAQRFVLTQRFNPPSGPNPKP